ncbi:hypothetical protein ACI2I3_00655 [Psychrobacter namhaensis]|uniref:Phage antitermination protein Q n=1 Tax=Psychrobacter namhaensis TaxID=292734 RepID=A0ABW8L7J0_9GAMM
MSDLSITDLMFAYGAWVNDDQTSLECKSPSLMLMKSAPKQCADAVKQPSKRVVAHITDDEALAVDRAMKLLRERHLVLYHVVRYYFIYNWTVLDIAVDYLTVLEYGNESKKKLSSYHTKPLLTEGMGFISGALARDTA